MWRDMLESEQDYLKMITRQVAIYLNMLGALMKYRIWCNVDGSFFVTMKHSGSILFNLKSFRKYWSHIISQMMEGMALYSISTEHLKIVVCFFDFQVMIKPPKSIVYPVMDFLEIRQFA